MLPQWFADEGGFLVESGRTDAWTRHVEFMAETFGDLVAGWQPVNETNYYARVASVDRSRPKPVYSLRVDTRDHSFLTNGFVSHNTDREWNSAH